MIAVIFEVIPAPGERERYLKIGAGLAPILANVEGFISIERFHSLSEPNRFLSLSFWRDEESVQQWRRDHTHGEAQDIGRSGMFSDYRIRVAQIIRDYGLHDRAEAPE